MRQKFEAGQIVKVDREKYYASVVALATDHPENFAGLGYIFEDREILEASPSLFGALADFKVVFDPRAHVEVSDSRSYCRFASSVRALMRI